MPSLGLRILRVLATSGEPFTIDGLSKELSEETVEVVLALAPLEDGGLVAPRIKACLLYWYLTTEGRNAYLTRSADFGCMGREAV